VFTTFEGDNTVLLQLVAKELLSAYQRELSKRPLRTIAGAIVEGVRTAVVDKNPAAIRSVDSESLLSFDFQERALSFRERSLRESLARRLKHRVDGGMNMQQAFDACQDHALALGKAHVEHFVLSAFQAAAGGDAKLARLCSLYGLWRIEADLAWFLENDYLAAPRSRAIRSQINELVGELRDDTRTLVDAFGIPETCLGPLADPAYLTRTGLATGG
jgi:acyl-CoA oxidase